MFCYPIFAQILRIIIQNRLHLLLKVLLHSKFIAKSTYRITRSRNLESVSDRSRKSRFRMFFLSFCISESRISLPTGLGVSDLLSYRLVFRCRIFQSSRIQLIELRKQIKTVSRNTHLRLYLLDHLLMPSMRICSRFHQQETCVTLDPEWRGVLFLM